MSPHREGRQLGGIDVNLGDAVQSILLLLILLVLLLGSNVVLYGLLFILVPIVVLAGAFGLFVLLTRARS